MIISPSLGIVVKNSARLFFMPINAASCRSKTEGVFPPHHDLALARFLVPLTRKVKCERLVVALIAQWVDGRMANGVAAMQSKDANLFIF